MSVECKRLKDFLANTLESCLCQSYIKQGAFVRGGVCPRGVCLGGTSPEENLEACPSGTFLWGGHLSYLQPRHPFINSVGFGISSDMFDN